MTDKELAEQLLIAADFLEDNGLACCEAVRVMQKIAQSVADRLGDWNIDLLRRLQYCRVSEIEYEYDGGETDFSTSTGNESVTLRFSLPKKMISRIDLPFWG